MKFGQILVCCMKNIFFHVFGSMLETGNWKLVPGPLMVLLNWQQRDLAIFNSWYLQIFNCPLFTFSKKKIKDWNLDIIDYSVIGAGCSIEDLELSPSLPNVRKIPENCCPCLYLSIDQVLTFLWFKRYVKKCILSRVLILIMTSHIW